MSAPSFICVILESPFAGKGDTPVARLVDRERNERYLAAAMLDCLKRGEAPFASHGLYTRCLDDDVPEQRELGIHAGFAWRSLAAKTVAYTDLGISRGMLYGLEAASAMFQVVEHRTLPGWA